MSNNQICSNCGDSITFMPFKIKDGVICNKCYARFFNSFKLNRTLAEIKSDYEISQQAKEVKRLTYVFGLPNKNGIKIDTFNKTIYILTPSTNLLNVLKQQWDEKPIQYNQILSTEIIQDGSSVIKTNRTSQVGGAILGNILLGPVGLLLGGLTGSKRTEGNVSQIELRIVINDIKSPTHIINFLNKKTNTSNNTYKNAINSARKLQDILSVIIKDADSEDEQKTPQAIENLQKSASIADELIKLSDLKNKGAITAEEYELLKKQLFNSIN